MEEITSPSENRLVDKYTDSLEEANKYNESLEQPAVTEQPEEVDKFSDIGDVAREISNACWWSTADRLRHCDSS